MADFRPNPDDPSAPRGPDPTLSRADPMLRDPAERARTGGAMWGWIAGIAVLILIGFIIVGGWGSGGRNGTNTAANRPASTAPAPATTGAATTGAAPSAPGAAPTAPASSR
jgi:hypothetical protein